MSVGAARRFDVIVLGIGGMGSATTYHLARRGKRVLGIERYDIPHSMGSSHGISRIIRLAYYEHPSYVPLLRRSYELWRELQQAFGEQLLHITGSIDAGPADSRCFRGSLESCELHDLPHEVLDGVAVHRRFPAYRLPDDHMAVLQPDGGFLLSERCIVAHVVAAQAHGAEIRARERVLAWEPLGEGVRVETEKGAYVAERLVVTAGAWAATLIPELAPLAVPERQVLAWLQPGRPELFTPDRFPVFNLEVDEGRYYGLPVVSVPGFKLGRYHHLDQDTEADAVDRECHPRDEAILREFAERYFPDGAGPTMTLRACLFTNSPDEHFIVDVHPRHPQVSLAAGFSGHGYKFCSVIGEIMADLAEAGTTAHDIGLFSLSRFRDGVARPA
ncbi:MAG: N-methyl-L-tryptophan oxidase [Chloroflexi bacterium]|nr:N-methyl-L-tryptophan oxidase [Chloroflexota bacterium]